MDEDEIEARTRKYFIPGAGGRAVEAALSKLATHDGEYALQITKRRTAKGYCIVVKGGALSDDGVEIPNSESIDI